MQAIAAALEKDGANVPALSALASLGCRGKYTANIERDFHRFAKTAYGMHLEPYTATVTMFKDDEL
eukprot:3407046-Alexandrium_andersonii.AAC.1